MDSCQNSKLLLILFFLVFSLVGLLVFFSIFHKNTLIVINNSGSLIPIVKISVEDDFFVIEDFEDQQEEKFSFYVKIDASYHMELFDSQGAIIVKEDFGYVTAGMGSETVVEIGEDWEIRQSQPKQLNTS